MDFIKENGSGVIVNIKGENIQIPSDDYPLMNNDIIRKFYRENTTELEDEKILEIIDEIELEEMYPYKNAEKLYYYLNMECYNPKVYTGWIIHGLEMVSPYVWVTIENGKRVSLIDGANFTIMENAAIKSLIHSNGLPLYEREALFFKDLNEAKDEDTLNRDKITIGKVSRNIYYIGCESTLNLAKSFYSFINNEPHMV